MGNKNKLLNIFSIVVLSVALVVAVLFTALTSAISSAEIDIENKVEEAVAVQGVFLSSGDATTASDAEYSSSNGTDKYHYAVRATVRPENAVDKSVIWSIAWENDDIQENIFNYLLLSIDGNSCDVECIQPFYNDAILTCRTNVGGFEAYCSVKWVGNIKVINCYPSDVNNQSIDFNGTYRYGVDYQFGSASDYRSDRSFSCVYSRIGGSIQIGIYNVDSDSWVNTNYETVQVSKDIKELDGDFMFVFAKYGSLFNNSVLDRDQLIFSLNYNPYTDDTYYHQLNGNTPNLYYVPYSCHLNFYWAVTESTSNLSTYAALGLNIPVFEVYISENSIEF